MLDKKRYLFKSWEKKIGKLFSSLSLTPNHYTCLAVVFALISFYFLMNQDFILTITFFLIAGFLDLVDGAVARYKGLESKVGAYLDTIFDRYVENILLIGFLFLPLPEIIFPSYVWVTLIIFGSLMTTYSKAAAKEKELVNQELKGGLFSRGERIIFILISLLFAIIESSLLWTTYCLILIAVLVNVTAFQRIFSAIQKNR
jgi:phosphatidylglycerophosphate synthase